MPPGPVPKRRSLRLQSRLSADPASGPHASLEQSFAVTRSDQPTSSSGSQPAKKPKQARKADPATASAARCVTLGKGYEERLWKRGLLTVAGVDEAGRGPLAGPVVAAACVVTDKVDICGITDSKKVKEADRERLFDLLTNHPSVRHGIGVVDAAGIDEMNILQATMRAMEQAVANIPGPAPTAVLVDGNRVPPGIRGQHIDSIIKGDAVCYSIAAASIIAKVTRDRMMAAAHAKWPQYGFAAHKGYGTKVHMAAVQKHGPCPIHRLTFRPLPEIVERLKEVAAGSSAPAGADEPSCGQEQVQGENTKAGN